VLGLELEQVLGLLLLLGQGGGHVTQLLLHCLQKIKTCRSWGMNLYL
jgi:hypothetical protein